MKKLLIANGYNFDYQYYDSIIVNWLNGCEDAAKTAFKALPKKNKKSCFSRMLFFRPGMPAFENVDIEHVKTFFNNFFYLV